MAPPTPNSRRPRKKGKFTTPPGSNNNLILDIGQGKQTPAFPLVSFLWAARAGVSQWLILPLTLIVVGLFRWAVSLWGYSGKRTLFWRRRMISLTFSRLPGTSHAWRLRGSTALDGDHHTPTNS